VNTGISGFIDSDGRFGDLLRAREEGTSVGQVMIDRRLTFYTKFGDVFAFACDGITVAIAVAAWWAAHKRKKDAA
jgi:apolipoprotein N-acyltransferase